LDEPTFDQLRTKEQLGYVVASNQQNTRDVLGTFILIQSPTKGCSHLRDRLDSHLATMREKVENMSDEEFQVIVGALMVRLSERDKNQREAFARCWAEFSTHKYLFERQEKEIGALSLIKKEHFQTYFYKMYYGDSKRLDLHYNSEAHRAEEEKAVVRPQIAVHHSLNKFKQSMGYFADAFKSNYARTTWKL
jgi:secreted Zn-dependent insulinase-like peptidase